MSNTTANVKVNELSSTITVTFPKPTQVVCFDHTDQYYLGETIQLSKDSSFTYKVPAGKEYVFLATTAGYVVPNIVTAKTGEKYITQIPPLGKGLCYIEKYSTQ